MRRVFAIGETVLDIVFKNQVPVAAKAGGSMLNTSVTLGRLGIPVYFISEYGIDQVGEMVDSFLKANGVNTQYVHRFSDGKSALALAFLDDNNNAHYSFYKSYPDQRLQIEIPAITNEDIVIFGSFYGITTAVRSVLLHILKQANEVGALILYNPNFRKSHLDELAILLPAIEENIAYSHIVKGSDEDFQLIFNANSSTEAFIALKDPSKFMIYTAGSQGAYFQSGSNAFHLPAHNLTPVSTIGAGDNFNAGLVYGLIGEGISRAGITGVSAEVWQKVLKHGIAFASEVCMSYENYISFEFAANYKSKK